MRLLFFRYRVYNEYKKSNLGVIFLSKYTERLSQHQEEINMLYHTLYGKGNTADEQLNALFDAMALAYKNRSRSLKSYDRYNMEWYKSEDVVGMMLYVDLFSENLEGLKKKIDYFKNLGITLIHLMPLLEPREGENDGGYAVKDYRSVNPDLGTMDELETLITDFRKEGIRVCIDFVVNHTADDHDWAIKAMAGDEQYQNLYMMYDSRDIPDLFEHTMPEVFPKVAPGNFTYNETMNKHVLTSFYPFQWDLNYQNPEVLVKIIDTLLFLANKGVSMIRLDAIPFMWKALGTNCRNLPEVHTLLRLMKIALEIVAPSVTILGEAIVEPENIIKYFGNDVFKECDVMYNATMMVASWNALATRDARHLSGMDRYRYLDHQCWINYVRCHDDIGWGLNENHLRQLGFDPEAHKQYLISFYEGRHESTFSVGELYEFDPVTNDARNSGTMASLCGLEKAVRENDEYGRELAIKRIKLLNAHTVLSQGIPMIYAGDELGLMNYYDYKLDEKKAHDSRWLHRQPQAWEKIENINTLTFEKEIYENLKTLIDLRKSSPIFGSQGELTPFNLSSNNCYGFMRTLNGEKVTLIFNFSEDRQFIDSFILKSYMGCEVVQEIRENRIIHLNDQVLVGPYQYLIIKG